MKVKDMSETTPLGGFKLRRGVKEGHCPECAVKHPPEAPHDVQSLYYQYSFKERHGRWPTWADALAHCDEAVRKQWIEQLATYGIKVES